MNLREIRVKIAGDILLSEEPGACLRKWRDFFGISQAELARRMGVSQATLSDYERNRRRPGMKFTRKFVESLTEMDLERGGKVLEELGYSPDEDYFQMGDFSSPLELKEVLELAKAELVVGEPRGKVAGYLLIDSVGVILRMPRRLYPWLSSNFPGRVVVFSQVSSGRTPMVVMKVISLRPALVLFPGISRLDPLAKLIAEAEKIPVALSSLPVETILANFERV